MSFLSYSCSIVIANFLHSFHNSVWFTSFYIKKQTNAKLHFTYRVQRCHQHQRLNKNTKKLAIHNILKIYASVPEIPIDRYLMQKLWNSLMVCLNSPDTIFLKGHRSIPQQSQWLLKKGTVNRLNHNMLPNYSNNIRLFKY